MEITLELLKTIRDRVEQVFLAKQNAKPHSIQMYEDGSFYCYHEYPISYSGTDLIEDYITVEELKSDLDELVKIRKQKEEEEQKERERLYEENRVKYEKQQYEQKLVEYNRLKKELGL